jgi:dihydropteroate synthase
VRAELVARVAGAIDAGVAPWKIALDPGIGFAKQPQQSAQLLRELRSLFRGLPHAVLVGPSRKSFIAHALSQAAGPRIDSSPRAPGRAWGTATAVSAAVAGGADIVRVHDVAEMRAVAAVADAIWRRG